MVKSLKSENFLIIVCVVLILGFGLINASETECGTTEFARELISRGTKTERGEFPFLVALFLVEEIKFLCGGSLITAKHILTAAHCIHQKDINTRRFPEDVVVLLGVYDLTSKIERGVLQRDVAEIDVHPDWRVYSDKYDADIAILVLGECVSFTNFIRPVCMPPDNANVFGSIGSVVGWGLTENGRQIHMEYPKKAVTNILNDSYCYTTDNIVALISSTRTFCGRGEVGSPNQGDSGGGLFVLYGSAWVQYGIISALRTNASGYIDANSIAVYTNVNEFKSWIDETIQKSAASAMTETPLSVSYKSVMNNTILETISCKYGYSKDDLYSCFLYDLEIRRKNIEVASFTGIHKSGNVDQNVEMIQFNNGTMFYPPYGIGNIFKNLRRLELWAIRTKVISRSHFKNMQNLVRLQISPNNIETLDEYTLRDLTNLEDLTIIYNQIKVIKEKTFESNVNLKNVDLTYNKLEYLPKHLFHNNVLLERVILDSNSISTIDEITFETNIKLRQVFLSSNKLEFLPRKLFQNNLLLESVDLRDNLLSIIQIDFTHFKNMKDIWILSNDCIDASYNSEVYGFLTNFQSLINANCSSMRSPLIAAAVGV